MIEITSLVKRYGSFTAVRGLTLTVNPGEICAFLGVNGAGKTSTIRMLVGVLAPTSGEIRICGLSLADEPENVKSMVGYVPDRPYLYPKLTGAELLSFVGDLYSVPRNLQRERSQALLRDYQLTSMQHELIESYSHGMRQRLAFCAALIHDPPVLIVDEPMVGLDPHGARLLKHLFREYARKGRSILLSTHSLDVAQEVADRLAIIHHGELIAQGTLDEIRAHRRASTGSLETLFIELTAEAGTENEMTSPLSTHASSD